MTKEREIELAWRQYRGNGWWNTKPSRFVRNRLAGEQNWRCCYCLVEMEMQEQVGQCHPRAATVEHLIPISLGGGHEESNLAIACFDCNAKRADKIWPIHYLVEF